MPTAFLSSEEYDERAQQLYDQGKYEGALGLLREGLELYPNAVDLYVGFAYAHLAREDFAWAKSAFEKAILLDVRNEDALVGLGETLLRVGRHAAALDAFADARQGAAGSDPAILMSIGRALYREGLAPQAREVFLEVLEIAPQIAQAHAGLAYTFHMDGQPRRARAALRRALELEPLLHEARVFLGHVLYEAARWEAALSEYRAVPAAEHWDPLAVRRVLELAAALEGAASGDPRAAPWEAHLRVLEEGESYVDRLLAEIEARGVSAEETRAD
ncbi:MAG: tetratricopeptide repeat protein [Gemmatimonadota bacterium]